MWSREAATLAARNLEHRLPVIVAEDVVPIDPARDIWDMWPIARRDGGTVIANDRQWWFFLAVPRAADPEWRHDEARIRLYSCGDDGWRDHGAAFPDGFSPGSREWSGSAVLDGDGTSLTMHFTAAGRRGEARTFEQRLYQTSGRFANGRLSDWTAPVETAVADGTIYDRARQAEPVDDRIKGFRDPGYLLDPGTGREHLLFTGSAAGSTDVYDGVIGMATWTDGVWRLDPPLIDATGVNSELERPHVVLHDGLYYLFWSTQAKRFAPGIGAPTGLYGMVADAMAGPWRPLNGSGLVAANPVDEPHQAYCWWVTGELEVISFVDYWGMGARNPASAADVRRASFGGTVAPLFSLDLSGDRSTVTPSTVASSTVTPSTVAGARVASYGSMPGRGAAGRPGGRRC